MSLTFNLLFALAFASTINANLEVTNGVYGRMDKNLYDKIQAAVWPACNMYDPEPLGTTSGATLPPQIQLAKLIDEGFSSSIASEGYFWVIEVAGQYEGNVRRGPSGHQPEDPVPQGEGRVQLYEATCTKGYNSYRAAVRVQLWIRTVHERIHSEVSAVCRDYAGHPSDIRSHIQDQLENGIRDEYDFTLQMLGPISTQSTPDRVPIGPFQYYQGECDGEPIKIQIWKVRMPNSYECSNSERFRNAVGYC